MGCWLYATDHASSKCTVLNLYLSIWLHCISSQYWQYTNIANNLLQAFHLMMVMCWEIMVFIFFLSAIAVMSRRGVTPLYSRPLWNIIKLSPQRCAAQPPVLPFIMSHISLDCIACCVVLRCICQGQSKSWSFLRAWNGNFLWVKGQSHEDLLQISQCRKSEGWLLPPKCYHLDLLGVWVIYHLCKVINRVSHVTVNNIYSASVYQCVNISTLIYCTLPFKSE